VAINSPIDDNAVDLTVTDRNSLEQPDD
jgi:hypothetical protein